MASVHRPRIIDYSMISGSRQRERGERDGKEGGRAVKMYEACKICEVHILTVTPCIYLKCANKDNV